MGGLIHVGAWDGEEFRDLDRELLLFEPQARPFRILQRDFAHRPDVWLVNAAAGARAGTATMYRVQPDHSSSLLRPDPAQLIGGFYPDGEETVQVTTIDETVRTYGIEGRFDTLTIDTQGYELEVLKGATVTLADISHVRCEPHSPQAYPGAATARQLDARLTAAGFARGESVPGNGEDGPDLCYDRVVS